jgi:hypothetical protein
VCVRSASSNVRTGSARDSQHRQRSSVATQLMTREQLCSESTPPGGHGRRLARLHRDAATRKSAESRQLPSHYDECSAWYPAGAPGLKQTALFRVPHSRACYEEDTISSPPLLVPVSPLQEGFPSVCIRHDQLPWSSVILTTVNICYSVCLRILTSHSSLTFHHNFMYAMHQVFKCNFTYTLHSTASSISLPSSLGRK